jgi:hypothetical protein
MLTTVSSIQPRVSGQSGPTIVKSPEIVQYKPVRPADAVKIQPCPADLASLAEPGVTYKMAPGILPPRVTRMVGVELTKEGRQAYKKGLFKDSNEIISKISVLVNVQGRPESPCLMRPAGFDLDEQSGNAALQYRFEPAQRNGSPISMRMGIEFRYEAH